MYSIKNLVKADYNLKVIDVQAFQWVVDLKKNINLSHRFKNMK